MGEIPSNPNNLHQLPIEQLPFVGKYISTKIKEFDTEIGELGLSQGVKRIIEKRNGVVNASFENDETIETLAKKGVIVIAEHPAFTADAAAILAALPARENNTAVDDTSFFAASEWAKVGPSIAQYILPLHVSSRLTGTYLEGLLRHFHLNRPELTYENTKQNLQTFSRGAQLAQSGSRVILFPDGTNINDRWQGVGKLIYKVGGDSDTSLVFAHVTGTQSAKDLLKFLPPMRALKPFNVTTTFSSPQRIADLAGLHLNSRDLNLKLQNDYAIWTQKVDQSTDSLR